jgi:hypothetical protein
LQAGRLQSSPLFYEKRHDWRGNREHHPSLEMVNLSAETVPLPLERFERLKELREQFPIGGYVVALAFARVTRSRRGPLLQLFQLPA